MSDTQKRRQEGYRGASCQRCHEQITSDQHEASLKEFPWALCEPCCEAGRKAGKGRPKDDSQLSPPEQSQVSPSLAIIRACCRKLDELNTAKEITLQADSEVLNKAMLEDDKCEMMMEAIRLYAEYRIMELRL
jgi:hypothetical protein